MKTPFVKYTLFAIIAVGLTIFIGGFDYLMEHFQHLGLSVILLLALAWAVFDLIRFLKKHRDNNQGS